MDFNEAAAKVQDFLRDRKLDRRDLQTIEVFSEMPSGLYLAWGRNASHTRMIDMPSAAVAEKVKSLLERGDAEPLMMMGEHPHAAAHRPYDPAFTADL